VSTANQLALATMMAAAAPSLCDAYANLWANADIGQGANTGNTLLYYTDGIHLTAKGSGIPASLIAQGINSVVP
jgi:lysophospholipase L1-like esterase